MREHWLIGEETECMTAKQAQALAKSFEATDLPARCSKFVARKQWVVIGSDDMLIRVFKYNAMDREKMFEAHTDYIRSVAVQSSLPYLLSCSHISLGSKHLNTCGAQQIVVRQILSTQGSTRP
jgi:hypothetical protein